MITDPLDRAFVSGAVSVFRRRAELARIRSGSRRNGTLWDDLADEFEVLLREMDPEPPEPVPVATGPQGSGGEMAEVAAE